MHTTTTELHDRELSPTKGSDGDASLVAEVPANLPECPALVAAAAVTAALILHPLRWERLHPLQP